MIKTRFRKHLKRILAVALLVPVVVTASSGWFYYRAANSSLPVMSGTIVVDGLSGPVEVRRDRHGIPHIVANTTVDLYFAQGFVEAQDRLWQMDLLRRDASGRLAEIFGEVAFERDRAQRTLGLEHVVGRSLETLEPEFRDALDAYARGVNAFVASADGALPFEFQILRYEPAPWEPKDSLLVGKVMAQTLSTTWQRDLMRADFSKLDPEIYADIFPSRSRYDLPFVGEDHPAAMERMEPTPQPGPIAAPRPGDGTGTGSARHDLSPLAPHLGANGEVEMLAGSNNWVVGGSRTATRMPLLANDPHLRLGAPSIWYIAHLRSSDGALNVAGVTFPGVPGIVIGHNDTIAWGVTNFGPDVQDLYAEEFDDSGRRYRADGVWHDAVVRSETIRVRRGSLTTEVEERRIDVVETRHGPIVETRGSTRFALRWVARDPVCELPTFHLLNRAHDWDTFRAALSVYPGPMQSFVYADRGGNIGYYAAGKVPVRRSGAGDRPYHGDSDEGDWIGFIPFERLPHAYNPASGYILTANNRIVGDSVSDFYTNEWMAPFRAYRIDESLENASNLSTADMTALQNDVVSVPDLAFAREVIELGEPELEAGSADAGEWRRLVETLRGWDGRLAVESSAAALVVTMKRRLFDRLLEAKLGPLAKRYAWFGRESFYTRLIEERPRRWLPADTPSWEAAVLRACRDARSDLEARFGSDESQWRYGRLNMVELAHPIGRNSWLGALLNIDPFEMAGGSHTVNATSSERGWGPSMRMVVDLQDLDRSTVILPTGQSGQHASDHYADQTEGWRSGAPLPLDFSEAAVERATTSRLVLTP